MHWWCLPYHTRFEQHKSPNFTYIFTIFLIFIACSWIGCMVNAYWTFYFHSKFCLFESNRHILDHIDTTPGAKLTRTSIYHDMTAHRLRFGGFVAIGISGEKDSLNTFPVTHRHLIIPGSVILYWYTSILWVRRPAIQQLSIAAQPILQIALKYESSFGWVSF